MRRYLPMPKYLVKNSLNSKNASDRKLADIKKALPPGSAFSFPIPRPSFDRTHFE